jgi:hypothetical protein
MIKELNSMNNKVGHSFKLTERCIEFLIIVHYLFSTHYRQIEGFTIALNKLIPKLPYANYFIKYDNTPYDLFQMLSYLIGLL